jgi:hypothetical protein
MTAMDPNAIVSVQVSTILAPFPSTYQQTGAIVSAGATTLAPQSTKVLTRFSDLEPILEPPNETVSGTTWTTGLVHITTQAPIPESIPIGTVVNMVMTGFTPAGYNGFFPCTITGANTFTYPLTTNPGPVTQEGQWQFANSSNLNAMVATFFRQGSAMTITVLEIGRQTTVANEVNALEQWLNTNPLSYYGYLLPYIWGSSTNIPVVLPLLAQYDNPEAMTYFWLTLDSPAAVGLIPSTHKCCIQMIEAPSVAPARAAAAPGAYAEYTLAAMFYWALQFRATAVTRVSPMCFKFLYGVTPYPLQNNGPFLLSLKANFVNYVQTGAEGGIAFTNVYQGVTADGFDYFNWWWTIDWVQININRNLSNAIINGSNNPLAPLYYNQDGINYLEGVLANTMITGNQYGLVNGPIVQTQFDPATLSDAISRGTFAAQCDVNAVPFLVYSQINPSDYGNGEYDGLSVLFIPARGFVHILVTVVATNIVTL